MNSLEISTEKQKLLKKNHMEILEIKNIFKGKKFGG
jgi:hypothetical protein